MDPQSQAFTPYSSNNETWRLQSEVSRLQQIQSEHAERIARLERRQDEDARVKSVWGNSSPFPSVLSGTPQQAPLQQPSNETFRGIDDEANNLISSLHLDAEEEPRRTMGAASRANSVRFDESANQNHFSHLPRPSFDYLSRTSSGLGSVGLGERSASHKSDGRASSAHSIRSAASRANSLNLDTFGIADSSRSSQDLPTLAPGLLLLGSVPAIIRCWMNLNFKHDALLYAAICTGSFRSYLGEDLVHKLGFEGDINESDSGSRTIQLPVYFPEAVPHPASSRSASPAHQLPAVTVKFELLPVTTTNAAGKSIQIFFGSDVLRTHNADILFSSNSMTLYDDDRSKLSIPLVRPEDEAVFNKLRIIAVDDKPAESHLNGIAHNPASTNSIPSAGKYRPPMAAASEADVGATSVEETRPASRASTASRPSLNITARTESQDTDASAPGLAQRSAGSPAVWSNWRKDPGTHTAAATPTQSTGLDWAAASRSRDTSYQRKDTGIKVLKPKSATRAFSATTTPTTTMVSPIGDAKTSRFFDDGRRKGEKSLTDKKEEAPQTAAANKTRTNPIGGGSAFSWLNSSNDPK